MTAMDVQWNWQSVCPPRVLRSLFAGAATGGLAVATGYAVETATSLGLLHLIHYGFAITTAIFVAAILVWLLGLIAFALVPWWIFHRLGFRNLLSAVILGFSMTFLVNLSITSHFFSGMAAPNPPPGVHEWFWEGGGYSEIDHVLTAHGWRLGMHSAAELGLIGALVAAVVWRTAYRAAGSIVATPQNISGA